MVDELNGKTAKAGRLIKWSDIIDSAWDSPELHQAALISEKLVIGHWDDLFEFRSRLNNLLKSILTDEMDYKHIDKSWQSKRHMVSWFVDTKSMMTMWISFPA